MLMNFKLRTFLKNENKYYFYIRKPFSVLGLEEKILYQYENFTVYKIFSKSLFIGYAFDFFKKDLIYSLYFLNYIEDTLEVNPNQSYNTLYQDANILILEKSLFKNILIVGEPDDNRD